MRIPKDAGRKFDIAKLAMWQGFVVTMVSILIVELSKNDTAKYVAEIVGHFATIQMVGVGAFNLANAATTTMATWKQGPTTKVEEFKSTSATGVAVETTTIENNGKTS